MRGVASDGHAASPRHADSTKPDRPPGEHPGWRIRPLAPDSWNVGNASSGDVLGAFPFRRWGRTRTVIDRLEILASRIRRLLSRHRWSAFLLGLPPSVGGDGEPGLVLIQLDGLNDSILREAIDNGRMPFLRQLERDEDYTVHSLYSGMPSSTPGFQAEFFYGVRTAVPTFGYFDRGLRRPVSMNDPFAASIVETRLLREHRGLLRHGSAWSNVFSGDAEEAHFCASTAGLDMLFRALNPLRWVGLVLWNLWSVVRVVFNLLAELAFALWDFVRQGIRGRDFLAELLFIPERVMVTAVMREIVTAGACVDSERGVPIIHLNLLGYDEHGHRRGPRASFATWTLRGIDKSIKRIWNAAHRSTLRDYQVWIYSDHGQEATRPWSEVHGEPMPEMVHRAIDAVLPPRITRRPQDEENSVRSETGRSRWLSLELPTWLRWGGRVSPEDPIPEPPTGPIDGRPPEITILNQGPVGSVTLHQNVAHDVLRELARAVAEDARVPHVLYLDDEDVVHVHRNDGRTFRLPDDALEVFGDEHPHLDLVTDDVIAVVRHEHSGDLVLMGFGREEYTSLQFERGAHGGPGPDETSAFAMLPREAPRVTESTLRAADLRALALRVLEGTVVDRPSARVVEDARPEERTRTVRVMTYNVHGCRGMDGRYSPQRIARVIARQEPDVICLQELDSRRRRSGDIDQAMVIAKALQIDFHFHAVAEVDDGHFGNAILSSLPIELVTSGALPRWRSGLGLEDRGVVWAEVDVDGVALQVLNTHLSILDRERRLQVDALLGADWLASPRLRGPAILCGDFNAPGRSSNLRRIDGLMRNVGTPASGEPPRPELNTWSSRLPMRRIDHVFATDDLMLDEIRVPRSRLTRIASDHLPVVVDLVLPQGRSGGAMNSGPTG